MNNNSLRNCKHVKSYKEPVFNKEDIVPVACIFSNDIIGLSCDSCNEKWDIVYDPQHGEIICLKCGYVLQDNVSL